MAKTFYKCTQCHWSGWDAHCVEEPAVWVCPSCGAVYDRTPVTTTEADPTGRDAHEPGAKLDAGKPMVWLCIQGFSHALQAVAEVTTKGAVKYTPNGWTQVPDGATRYMDAFGRHMLDYGSGEAIDPGTGCLHKAQMIWNLLASLELELRAQKKIGTEHQTNKENL